MKKLFVLFLTLFTSAILFFSCDPHAEGNAVTISINTESINSILKNTAARTADPRPDDDNSLCVYALLKGSEGSKYEKTVYIQNPENGNSEKVELTLSMIPYREEYELFVYLVRNGDALAVYKKQLELNRFGPTKESITLNIPDNGSPFTSFYGDFYLFPSQNDTNPTGNHSLIWVGTSSQGVPEEYKVKFNNSAPVSFICSGQQSAPNEAYNNYTFEMYLLHNGKQTNIPMTDYYDEMNTFTTYFNYTFKSTGTYTAALRITQKRTGLFITKYIPVTFKENIMNTDFMIYSTGTRLSAKTSSSFSDTNDYSGAYDNAAPNAYGDNPFDFCFDNDMNYYVTNGNSIFKNSDYINTYIDINTHNIYAKKINYDTGSDLFIIYGTKYGMRGFTVYNNNYNLNNWFDNPESGSGLELLNVTVHGAKAYLFFNYNDYSSYTSSLILYVYDFFETKPGVLAFSGAPEKYRIMEKPYPFGALNNFDVGDIIIIDNKLYFLANTDNKMVEDGGNIFGCIVSFGFLGKIDLGNMNISIIGASNMTSKNETLDGYNNSKYYYTNEVSKYISNSNDKNFSFPQKFVAIKPKQLVIADDGYMFWSDTDKDWYKNLNRAFTINLDSFAITNVEILNNIKWKFEATGNLSSLSTIYLAN